MVAARIGFWLSALFASLILLAAPLSAAVTPVGDVSPSTIGQLPSQEVVVGNTDVGGLLIDAGGVLTTQTGTLGLSEFGVGVVTITGSGSQWTNSSALTVGNRGTGTLSVEVGGQVSSSTGYLGRDSGATGEATINGPGSVWTINNSFFVGSSGSGSLRVENGGLFSGGVGYLGFISGAIGEATITGPDSRWTTRSSLFVGRDGNGSLRVEGGGQASSSSSYLGYSPGATGNATVTGHGSQWTSTGGLLVGHDGTGSLTVADGGQVVAGTLFASLGNLHGDGWITATQGAVLDANLLLDGAHGTQNTIPFGSGGTLAVTAGGGALGAGYKGLGSLTVADGIVVTSTFGVVGYYVSATGEATITGSGSKWTNSFDLDIGRGGSGTLRVENGGQVSSSNSGYLGRETGATGKAVIADTGSTLTIGDDLYVGRDGSGSLRVEGGGQVSSGGVGYLGLNSGATGETTITGPASKWSHSGSLNVGDYGNGTFRIEDGGRVTNNGGILGKNPGASGEATINGPSSQWTNYGDLILGNYGSGTLRVEDGGLVYSSLNGYLGNAAGSVGEATITGPGSQWENNEDLYIGRNGSGILRVEEGGLITNFRYSYLGHSPDATGEATITGPGSKWTNINDLYVGYHGSGTLSITNGGLVTVVGTLTIDQFTSGASHVNIATGGMLAFQGDVDFSLVQFLNRISGTDAIRYWDASLTNWSPLTAATFGEDYTLEYLTTGDLAGYTLLTVGSVGDVDFDGDGDVDGRDFLAWQRYPELGSLADWQNAYGSESLSAATAVPEPSCLVLLMRLVFLGRRIRPRAGVVQ